MLSYLSIRDLAIIDHVELEFQAGFTALTGETGAGKSILLDGLQLALGGRADSSLVREGAGRAEIVASFDAPDDTLSDWLGRHELEAGDELMLRRVVGADGRSRAWVNTTPVPIQTLRELGERLVEIHGQNEHQFLQRPARQVEMLDAYAGHATLLAELADDFRALREAAAELERLRAEAALAPAERELIEFQVEELSQAALGADELERLEAEHRSLAHAGELLEAAATAAGLIEDDEDRAGALIIQAMRILEDARRYDEGLGEVHGLLDNALIQLREAQAELVRLNDRLELDPDRLVQADRRLSAIHQLARKHRVEPTDLMARLDALSQRLERAAASDSEEKALTERVSALGASYAKRAQALSRSRGAAARRFEQALSASMAELGMKQGRFEVRVAFEPDRPPSTQGLDEVEFLISTNPGSPPKPLARVASGGELSRICLAIKVVIAELDEKATMIFDEVDAGVGGGTAQIVGAKLRAVAAGRQVFSVTHLPQVASCAHHQVRIAKEAAGNQTRTHAQALDESERVQEIARMLGGVEVTDKATEHAREMMAAGKAGGP